MQKIINRAARLLPVSVLVAAVVISAILNTTPAEAESFTVRVPVSCTGADCEAVLCDMEGKELDFLSLKEGTESFFEIICKGVGQEEYLVKLKNQDTDTIIFDRTEFSVKISACPGENSELLWTVTVHPSETEKQDKGKSASLEFRNTVRTPALPAQEAKASNDLRESGIPGTAAGEKAASTHTLQNGGNATGSSSPSQTDWKLPQTGSRYLWMAPFLAIAGGIMIAAGCKVRKKQTHRNQ